MYLYYYTLHLKTTAIKISANIVNKIDIYKFQTKFSDYSLRKTKRLAFLTKKTIKIVPLQIHEFDRIIMNDIINIKNRINWIDWAKAIAIFFVVYGHIPEEEGSYFHNYIILFHMPLFFFISGYLTKVEYFSTSTLKKYWHTLVIPYLFYNIIFYPYWVVKHLIKFPNAEWFDYVKPFGGMILFQIETPISLYLNGVTWFIAALLIMKIILSVCNKCKYGFLYISIIVLLCVISYIVNEQYRFTTGLTTVGFMKCFPFFIIGFLCKQKKWITPKTHQRDIIICFGGIITSLTIYSIERGTDGMLSYGIYFWTTCITAIIGVLFLCKLLDNIELDVIKNISLGTIVIMGLHWILIGSTNVIISKITHVDNIIYPLWGTILLASIFIAILYPIIVLFKKRYPFLLGKWTATTKS